MKNELKNAGFSLTEVLMAVGTLAIGLIFIGGTFLAGIHFSTTATERTIAAVAADEAFAKIKLFGGLNTNWISALDPVECNNFSVFVPLDPNEFAYPSTRMDLAEKQYFWSALCRLTEDYNDVNNPNPPVQVTVFVSRKVGSGTTWPVPVKVGVSVVLGPGNENKLTINVAGEKSYINDGDTIVDDENGQIYRVLKRYPSPDDTILLNRTWEPGIVSPDKVWVVPPPVGSGRKPCIAVYQKGIIF